MQPVDFTDDRKQFEFPSLLLKLDSVLRKSNETRRSSRHVNLCLIYVFSVTLIFLDANVFVLIIVIIHSSGAATHH